MNKKKRSMVMIRQSFRSIAAVLIAAVLLLGVTAIPDANANSVEEEIQALQESNERNQAAVNDLLETARSYEDAIEQLQSEISYLQGKIDNNLARQAELKAEIEKNQQELDRQREVLAADLRAMYVDGDITTIEMLATSKNLSEFVDKEAYRNAVQKKIQETLRVITQLQSKLKAQKEEIDRLLTEQQSEQSKLHNRQSEQQSLLNANQGQRSEFNRKTAANDARIADLIAQQLAANNSVDGGYYFLRFPGQVNGFNPDAYPYKNAGFSMQLGPCGPHDSWPDDLDAWGYCTRQCVSYAAWAVGASGRQIPMYYGSAKNWVGKAYDRGIPVYRSPQRGDIAISTAGTWGHAMYVEQVEGDRIHISQYNAQLTGHFSYQWRKWR